jgi:hypothetical protein
MNTYDTSSDGFIYYQNIGSGAEVNPTVTFDIPGGANLDTSGCAFANQSAPGCTADTCNQSGTKITYSFTGSLPAGSQVQLFYSTDQASEAPATNITITASSCP